MFRVDISECSDETFKPRLCTWSMATFVSERGCRLGSERAAREFGVYYRKSQPIPEWQGPSHNKLFHLSTYETLKKVSKPLQSYSYIASTKKAAHLSGMGGSNITPP